MMEDMQIVLIALVAINIAVTVFLLVGYNRLRGLLHGPRVRLDNPYVARDMAEGGPLSRTGVVPSGSNVTPLRANQSARRLDVGDKTGRDRKALQDNMVRLTSREQEGERSSRSQADDPRPVS